MNQEKNLILEVTNGRLSSSLARISKPDLLLGIFDL